MRDMPTSSSSVGNCSIRCSIEKRSYCRELQKWSKNLLYMVGLENVAKKLTNKRSWIKISPFIDAGPSTNPNCDQTSECQDWNPEEHCPICKGKGKEKASKPVETVKATAVETKQVKETPTSTFSGVGGATIADLFDMQPSLGRNPLDSLTYSSLPYYDLGQAYLSQLMLHWSKLGAFPMAPSMGPLFMPFAQTNVQSPQPPAATNDHSSAKFVVEATPSSEEPLDLSVKPIAVAQSTESKSNKNVANSIAQVVTAQQSNASKKTYSQADLEAAVHDIRSGKLGTRRASVVYGIPRSTLRNKIYKLEASEDGGAARKKKKVTNVVAAAPPPVAAVVPAAPPAEKSPVRSVTSEESSETTSPGHATYSQSAATEKLVNELAKYKAETISTYWMVAGGHLLDADSSHVKKLDQSELVKAAVDEASHSALTGQLKIGVKKSHSAAKSAAPVSSKRPRSTSSRNESPSMDAFDPNRKIRPKRGQYRRYDKNALAEAVQSVRRGEMSVHRAGSYYGVPHSTLEYKVKERNLLRPKKRDQTRQANGGGAESPKSNVEVESKGEDGGTPEDRTSTDERQSYSPISREILNCLKTTSPLSSAESSGDVATIGGGGGNIWKLPTFAAAKEETEVQSGCSAENGNADELVLKANVETVVN